MRGLRAKESNEFIRFFDIVQKEAQKLGCVFFLFTGEGRDIPLPDLEGMDLSGWLVPKPEADAFERDWERDIFLSGTDRWDAFETIAVWSLTDGEVTIEFE